MARIAFQANYRGSKITVFISADYSLWHWVPGRGQQVIDCKPCDWIERHGIVNAATARARKIFACFKPPVAPTNLNIANQKKSTPKERQAPSMSRKNAHEK